MNENPNPFRNATNSRYLKALFWELRYHLDDDVSLYTLKDVDHQGKPSLYRLYMEMEDQTEYEFATKYLDGYEHWKMLCNCEWFKPHVARWREELDLKLKARYLRRIKQEALSNSQGSFQAAKYLLEKGWEPKETKGRGRPSKAEIEGIKKQEALIAKELEDDFNRVMLKVVN